LLRVGLLLLHLVQQHADLLRQLLSRLPKPWDPNAFETRPLADIGGDVFFCAAAWTRCGCTLLDPEKFEIRLAARGAFRRSRAELANLRAHPLARSGLEAIADRRESFAVQTEGKVAHAGLRHFDAQPNDVAVECQLPDQLLRIFSIGSGADAQFELRLPALSR
jgi:hypothetical protein